MPPRRVVRHSPGFAAFCRLHGRWSRCRERCESARPRHGVVRLVCRVAAISHATIVRPCLARDNSTPSVKSGPTTAGRRLRRRPTIAARIAHGSRPIRHGGPRLLDLAAGPSAFEAGNAHGAEQSGIDRRRDRGSCPNTWLAPPTARTARTARMISLSATNSNSAPAHQFRSGQVEQEQRDHDGRNKTANDDAMGGGEAKRGGIGTEGLGDHRADARSGDRPDVHSAPAERVW